MQGDGKMQMDKGTFKKMFPHLAEEIEEGQSKVNINTVRSNPVAGEKATASKCFDNYTPDVIDFLCRCDTAKQAEEIIDYMEKRREIDHKYAQKLKTQLKKNGVRSFGAKREEDYYLRESGH
jgi:hypothetical protein